MSWSKCGGSEETAGYVLDGLGERFSRGGDLDDRLERLHRHSRTRAHTPQLIELITDIADRSYGVEFRGEIPPLAERVLWPATDAEEAGMEDARFVRFVEDDGQATYYATYTAYDGVEISQQMLTTKDFRTFDSTPMVGAAAANKGLALFPRRIHGRFAAMSRSDRESNTVAFSDHLSVWTTTQECQKPSAVWETLQLGNCGSPLETGAGWLVLTHGVGPMRTYSIGGDTPRPRRSHPDHRAAAVCPAASRGRRAGRYVPNVVYSCGALVHADTLVLPYGIGDCAIGIATVALPELLAAMQP